MDQRRVILLVEQFLQECGLSETLECLQRESGISFESGQVGYPEKGGELMEKLTAQHELECVLAEEDGEDRSTPLARQLTLPPGPSDIPIGVKQSDDLLPSSSSSSASTSQPVPHSSGQLVTGLHRGGVTSIKISPNGAIVASGGTDRSVILSTPIDGKILASFPSIHDGAVLGLAWNPRADRRHWLLTSAMDGQVKILDCKHALSGDTSDLAAIVGAASSQLHTKYVIRVRWHPDGVHFATASYDQTASLCRAVVDETTGEVRIERVQQYFFTANVEAVEFSPDGEHLLIAPRSDNYLSVATVADPTTVTRRNLNANKDDHVSFSVLDLAFSPDGQALLVQTDIQRIILLHYGTFAHLRNFYGAQNDQFSQPAAGWDPSSKFIFGSSLDFSIYIWEIASQKVVHRLRGHTKKLRCFDIDHQRRLIVSGGFDSALCYYTSE